MDRATSLTGAYDAGADEYAAPSSLPAASSAAGSDGNGIMRFRP